jgi:hypothetical protein
LVKRVLLEAVGVITLKPVEGLVEVTEEGSILRVDGIGRHHHDADTTPPLDRPTHPSSSVRADMGEPCRHVTNADRRLCIPQFRVGNLPASRCLPDFRIHGCGVCR